MLAYVPPSVLNNFNEKDKKVFKAARNKERKRIRQQIYRDNLKRKQKNGYKKIPSVNGIVDAIVDKVSNMFEL